MLCSIGKFLLTRPQNPRSRDLPLGSALGCFRNKQFSTNGIGILQSNAYVEKCRYIQLLKEDSKICSSLLLKGKFLVFCGSRPFLKTVKNFPEDKTEILWLSSQDVQEFGHLPSSVLLDVDENKNHYFCLQLGKLEAHIEKLEEAKDGTFYDLRASVFLVDSLSAQLLSKGNSLLMFHKKHKFCGSCGQEMARNCSGTSRSCSVCKNVMYPTLSPVGIVLVTDATNEKVILVRQPRHPPGMYSCIAGFCDIGECLEDTVKREVAEEVGIEVSHIQYVASQYWPFPGSLMNGCYAVTQQSQLSVDTTELEDARWFSKDEIGRAINATENNPSLMFQSKNEGGVYIPRPGAIAYHLIKYWHQKSNDGKFNFH